jgi:capsular polysaccharide transport system permease protein
VSGSSIVSDIEAATAALRAAEYNRADGILTTLGGGKSGNAARLRLLWAITQIMCRKFGDGIEAILEVAGRARDRSDPIYRKVLLATGPLESLLPAAAAQEVRLRVGDYFLREEMADEAMAWLSAARAAAPADPLAIYLDANCRAALYGERRAVAEMEEILDRAAAETERAYFVAGGTAALSYRLGLAYERMRALAPAALHLRAAVRLDPRAESPRILLGDVLIRLGLFEEAAAQLGAVDKTAEAYHIAARLRAGALFRLGETEAALELLREVADLDPLGALTFLEMARIYLALGDGERAEVALARAFRTNPELPGLEAAIVSLERQLGRHMDPDAGLPPPESFAIPAAFAPHPDDPAVARRPSLRAGIAAHLRVLHALIVRDILSKHSHAGMGYLWAFAQPLVYVVTLDLVYTLVGRHAPLGTSNFAFLAAGIVPFFCFYIQVQSAVSSAVSSNLNLLYFRQVTPLSLILANAVRQYLTGLIFFAVICAGIAYFDPKVELSNPLLMWAAVTCLALLAMCIGSIIGIGELAFPWLRLLEVVIFRFMFFFSGALFYANMMPPQYRRWALLNPLFHLIEFVREGFFGTYHARYANWHYPLEWIVVGLCIMMLLLSKARQYAAAR